MELIQVIKKQLTKSLPGENAHFQMLSKDMQANRGKVERPAKVKKAAVMILLYQKNEAWFTLLMQRPESPYAHSKEVCLPGGGYEAEDGNLETTALRETEEEFGIDRNVIEVLGPLTDIYIPVSNYEVQPFIGLLKKAPLLNPDPSEVDEIISVALSDLINHANRKEKNITTSAGDSINNVPYFELEKRTVWGATAMMLSEFIALVTEVAENA
jgi:8-oxo-dGTP pyrophosphatase MutT (NUDIX family)